MVAITAVPDRPLRLAAVAWRRGAVAWRRGAVAWRQAAGLPMTVVMVTSLVAVTTFLNTHPGDVDGIVAWASTNVHNLATHPVAAMIGSAFVAPGLSWTELVLVALGCGIVERTLGTRRTLVVALVGQVVATLMTEYGAAAASSLRWVAFSSPYRPDVGISYVMFVLLGAAASVLPSRRRTIVLGVLVVVVAVPLAGEPGMTTAGHALSLLCGVAAAGVLGRSRPALPAGRELNPLPVAGNL